MKPIVFVVALLGADLSSAGACWAQSATWGGTAGVAAMRGYTASSGLGLPGGDAVPATAIPSLGTDDAVATAPSTAAPLLRRVARRSAAGRVGRPNHRPQARLL